MSTAVKPMTVVTPPVYVTLDEMAARVLETRHAHGETLQRFHEIWYQSGHTWTFTHFLGVGLMKSPNDLWAYQEIIATHRPKTIIETGTYQGGSALWFAFLQQMLGIEGKVYTIDYQDQRHCHHPRIEFIEGDSANPALAKALIAEIQYPLLVVLDSDHSAAHVRRELDLYAPALQVGDWIVVEDTNISWGVHTVTVTERGGECSCGQRFPIGVISLGGVMCPNDDGRGDLGAAGGVSGYLRDHPGEFRQDVLAERWLLTMAPGGWLQRVAHGA